MSEYAATVCRPGFTGSIDKLQLCRAFATKHAMENRDLHRLVLDKVQSCGSSAMEQALCWEAYVCSLPYRREANEILRDPVDTAYYGGDCDDLSILFMAGAVHLGIPSDLELLCYPDTGDAYHIRACFSLPPLGPTHTYIVDPVIWSERAWAMNGVSPQIKNRVARTNGMMGDLDPSTSHDYGAIPPDKPTGGSVWPIILVVGGGYLMTRR